MSIVAPLARAAVSAALVACTPLAEAQTQSPCAERNELVLRLEQSYGETLQSMGLHQDNTLLEVYASEETGTWTITPSSRSVWVTGRSSSTSPSLSVTVSVAV